MAYTDADVARLRLLRQAVEQGHSIGRLAGLTDTDLLGLAVPAGTTAAPAADPVRPTSASIPPRSARRCRSTTPSRSTGRSRVRRPSSVPSTCPRRADAGAGAGRRRLASRTRRHRAGAPDVPRPVRHILGPFLRLYAQPDAKVRLVFATPSGDRPTRLARLARRCSRPAADWASRIRAGSSRTGDCRERDVREALRRWCSD